MWGQLAAAVGGSLLNQIGDNRPEGDLTARNNYQWQKEFAQNGISWRVDDAKAAGVHPLFALGANVSSFSPQAVFPEGRRDSGIDGQDISRAVYATATGETRAAAQLSALTLERASLENDLLRAQIAKLNPSQVGPPLPNAANPNPGAGSGDFAYDPSVSVKPVEVAATWRGNPDQKAGAQPETTWARNKNGAWVPYPNQDVIGDTEGPFGWEYFMRNRVAPAFGSTSGQPPHTLLPDANSHWEWSTAEGGWIPVTPPGDPEQNYFDSIAGGQVPPDLAKPSSGPTRADVEAWARAWMEWFKRQAGY